MRPSSPALRNYLASRGSVDPALFANLLTWKLADGSFLRLADFSAALAPPANSFPGPDIFGRGASINFAASGSPVAFPLGPLIGPIKWQVKIGTQPDTTEIEIFPSPNDWIGVYTWQEACLNKLFDGAFLEIDRLFMPTPFDYSLGSFVLYYGRVGEINVGRSRIMMRVPSLLVLLGTMMPRRVYGAPCGHIFGDAMCQFDRASLAADFTCGGGSVQYLLTGGPSPTPPTQYDQGTVTGLTGANAGVMRTVAELNSGLVILMIPYAFPVVPGDQFRLLPGCSHTVERCQELGNFAHFGGFPNIPPPESAL